MRDEACDYLECLEISRTSTLLPTITDEEFETPVIVQEEQTIASSEAGATSGDGQDSAAAQNGNGAPISPGGNNDSSDEEEDADAVPPIVGCSPFSPKEGQIIISALPSSLAEDFEKLPVMAETSFSNSTAQDLFRFAFAMIRLL